MVQNDMSSKIKKIIETQPTGLSSSFSESEGKWF